MLINGVNILLYYVKNKNREHLRIQHPLNQNIYIINDTNQYTYHCNNNNYI